MLETGKLYYFKNYDFERDGSIPLNKFFIILSNPKNVEVLAILVTSQGYHLPENFRSDNGQCIINLSEKIHCFQINKDIPITDKNFSFNLDSYIPVFKNIIQKDATYIWDKYITTNQYEDKGVLNDDLFLNLVYCIYKDKSDVIIPFKNILESLIEELCSKVQ